MSPQRLEDADERQRRLDADPWLALVSRPRAALFLARILALSLLGAVLILTFAPWQQFSTASGRVVAYAPALRRQSIDAPVDGRVVRWFVAEGALVRQGEPIVALEDNDPDLVERMRMQLESHRLRADSMGMRRQALDERITSIRASREVALMAADQRIDMARERLTAAQTDEAAAAAQLEAATLHAQRQRGLAEQGLASSRTLELAELDLRQSQAALDRGRASRRAAESELRSLRADRDRIALDASAQIDSALSELRQAEAGEQDARIALATFESQLARQQTQVVTAPRDGRVQYRVAQPGEVLSAGGRILNLVDLSDVYMTFFLPTGEAGRIAIGTEARLVIDAAPHYVIPARITFVADVAQFTPKTVETAEERQKLMFRVKAHIDKELLQKHIRQVKTGLPGMAYVRIDPQAVWPAELDRNLVQ